jgi:hypothetical protein
VPREKRDPVLESLTSNAFGGTKVKVMGRGSPFFRPGSDAETVAAARDSAPLHQTPK